MIITMDSGDVYDDVSDLLKRKISNSESTQTKISAIHGLAIAAFFGGAFLVRNPNRAWTRPEPGTSGRRVPMNEDAAAAVVMAAIGGCVAVVEEEEGAEETERARFRTVVV